MNVAIVTPASTSAPVICVAPTERPSAYVTTTAAIAPANAASGTVQVLPVAAADA